MVLERDEMEEEKEAKDKLTTVNLEPPITRNNLLLASGIVHPRSNEYPNYRKQSLSTLTSSKEGEKEIFTSRKRKLEKAKETPSTKDDKKAARPSKKPRLNRNLPEILKKKEKENEINESNSQELGENMVHNLQANEQSIFITQITEGLITKSVILSLSRGSAPNEERVAKDVDKLEGAKEEAEDNVEAVKLKTKKTQVLRESVADKVQSIRQRLEGKEKELLPFTERQNEIRQALEDSNGEIEKAEKGKQSLEDVTKQLEDSVELSTRREYRLRVEFTFCFVGFHIGKESEANR